MPGDLFTKRAYPRSLEGRFPTSLERAQRIQQTRRRRWITAGVTAGLMAGVAALGLWAADAGPVVGTEEETEFAQDALAGRPLEAYPQVIILSADPETLDEPISVRSTPATNPNIDRTYPTSNRVGRLLSSVLIERPLRINGHIPLRRSYAAEAATINGIRAYLDWINEDVLDQVRLDGSSYGICLRMPGVDEWEPISTTFNPDSRHFEDAQGEWVNVDHTGRFNDLVAQANEMGYTETC